MSTFLLIIPNIDINAEQPRNLIAGTPSMIEKFTNEHFKLEGSLDDCLLQLRKEDR